MVYRIYVEKKQGLRHEADALYDELKNLLGIEKLEKVRLFNRYDVENISEKLFSEASRTVLPNPNSMLQPGNFPKRTELFLQRSIFPVSLTNARTRQVNVSRLFPAVTDRR